jgi:fructose/tagatose bisphosphate aldolase
MVDLSEEPKDENIQLTKKYFKRAVPMKQWLEMEIGITGGEEDGKLPSQLGYGEADGKVLITLEWTMLPCILNRKISGMYTLHSQK